MSQPAGAAVPPPSLQIGIADLDMPSFDGIMDLDFNLLDFDILGLGDGIETEQRYLKPKFYRPNDLVCYEHAREFAEGIDLVEGVNVFAFVSGNFIFADFIEALVEMGKLSVRTMEIQTLSMSQDNIDSLRNIIEMEPVERLDLVLSDYWYSHEKHELVPYLYEQLDVGGLDFNVAYASCHTKIFNIETRGGNKLVMHGSANLRSSRNIEQVAIEHNGELYDFVHEFTQRIIEKYNVVNHDAERPKSIRGGKLWQAAAVTGAAAGAKAAPAQRTAARTKENA